MKEIKFPVNDDEYLEVLKKKGSKTHKEVYFESLGLDYTRPPTGRPAFDPIEFEKRMMQIHLAKIREYDELHKDDVAKARAELGLDAKVGETTPALGVKNYRRKQE